jgi:hypothetical protein
MIGSSCAGVNSVFMGVVCVVVFHPMAELETRQRKRTGHLPHSLTGGGQQIDAALSEILRFGLREGPAIADHDAILEPTGEGIEELAIIDGRGGEIKAAQASRFITLHTELTASPPAHAGLRRARPGPKGAICWRTRAT